MFDVPVEVKKAFKKGRTKKQYRIEVYTINDDNTLTYVFTIGNDNLVKESVKIDERMCSDKYLKFGLCEGSSMEFQYFGMDSITGKELKVYLDVWYDDGNGGAWYPIMMGYYEVDASSTQFSTGIRKVTAYNKLQAKYLDEKANSLILEEFGFEEEAYVGDVINELMADYSIDKQYEKITPSYDYWQNTTTKATTSAYKYSGEYSDQGPFGPAVLYACDPTFSISKNIYLSCGCAYRDYLNSINPVTHEYYPIKISPPDFLDDLDIEISDYYKEQLGLIQTTTSVSTIWGWIRNLKGQDTTPNNKLQNYFLNVTIRYGDGTYEYYGNNVLNSAGTFAELAKKTLLNVVEVMVFFPRSISFFTNDSSGLSGEPTNSVRCQGADGRYWYNILEGGVVKQKTAYYTTPKLPDGSDIDYETLIENVAVSKIIQGTSEADYIKISTKSLPEVTLRELQSAVYEMNCQYGQINRVTDMFSGVELDSTGLYPSETLYPADNLYPNGNTGGKAIHPYPSEYQKLWTDTVGVQSFRYLRITYKTIEDGNEVEKVLQRTINEHGTQNYNMSDNWLFRNLVWTSAQVGEYADAMVAKMENIRWFPFEMWSVGLPYVETGDAIEIADKEGNTYTTYILQRQLRGIQNLQDTFINGELDVF